MWAAALCLPALPTHLYGSCVAGGFEHRHDVGQRQARVHNVFHLEVQVRVCESVAGADERSIAMKSRLENDPPPPSRKGSHAPPCTRCPPSSHASFPPSSPARPAVQLHMAPEVWIPEPSLHTSPTLPLTHHQHVLPRNRAQVETAVQLHLARCLGSGAIRRCLEEVHLEDRGQRGDGAHQI